jgi:hypothetical protein
MDLAYMTNVQPRNPKAHPGNCTPVLVRANESSKKWDTRRKRGATAKANAHNDCREQRRSLRNGNTKTNKEKNLATLARCLANKEGEKEIKLIRLD